MVKEMLNTRTYILTLVIIMVLALFGNITYAQSRNPSSDSNIPTNPNDPNYPGIPNNDSAPIIPPPNQEIVIPKPDRRPVDDPTFPDNRPPNVPSNPNIPDRDPDPKPLSPVITMPELEIPAEPEIPRDPVADPNIPRPGDPIPEIPELPDDPSLIEPDMDTEFLTAPVFKDEMPEILESDLNNYVQKQVLVLLQGTSGKQQDIDSLSQTYDLNNIDSSTLASINATMVLFTIPDNRGVIDVSRILAADSRTLIAQPNFYFEGMSEESAQYGVTKIKADTAHSISTGKGIKVAVVDTGIDYGHQALADNIVIKSDFVDVNSDKFDVHGTSIAGIIASSSIENGVTGVAPDVQIIAARACWRNPKDNIRTLCSSNTLAKAIDYAILNKAHIINLSLGGPKDNIVSMLIRKADRAGIVVVAAAGNGGPKGKPTYPAALREVIAISATDSDDKIYQESTRGSYIDLSAPGVDILSPAPGNSWQIVSGTSMAAAHVSGAIALILQENPELSRFQIKAILGSTSLDLGKKGKDNEYGEGRIDALSALHQLNNGL